MEKEIKLAILKKATLMEKEGFEKYYETTGKNKGKRTIWLNGKNTKQNTEHTHPRFHKYVSTNFNRLK